jgi:4-carboxymuconolactone decarboxylase
MASRPIEASGELPTTFEEFVSRFPLLAEAHESIAKTVDDTGPLDRKTGELIKIGICLGGGLESALRSHVRRAIEHGATKQEIEQSILMGMTTCGFPRTVAAWKWAQEQFARSGQTGKR